MKKIITTVSLAAIGVAGLQADSFYAPAPYLTQMDMSKPWSVSVALRGFYDDNYVMAPKGLERDSFGFELSPSASYRFMSEQTFLGLSYTYSMRFYEDRKDHRADHSHQFNAKLNHAFSDRFKLEVNDTFVIAQEPTILEQGTTITGPILLRSNGDNIHNRGDITLKGQVTELFGIGVGYENNFYDYRSKGPASWSALLDRLEHYIHVDARWQAVPDTVVLMGYQYGIVDHTSNDSLSTLPPPAYVNPNVRDSRSHYLYVGAEHTFTDQLSASARIGAQYTEYNNVPGQRDEWGPYAEVNATYSYLPGSFVQLGIRHSKNQTDIAFLDASTDLTRLTLDQESTIIYGQLVHRITPQLVGSLIGQYQHGEFHGGLANGQTDDMYLLGINLTYNFDTHWSAEVGYNYDRLDSDIPFRTFDRNRVYLGVRATF